MPIPRQQCPSCGAPVPPRPESGSAYCGYCGSLLPEPSAERDRASGARDREREDSLRELRASLARTNAEIQTLVARRKGTAAYRGGRDSESDWLPTALGCLGLLVLAGVVFGSGGGIFNNVCLLLLAFAGALLAAYGAQADREGRIRRIWAQGEDERRRERLHELDAEIGVLHERMLQFADRIRRMEAADDE